MLTRPYMNILIPLLIIGFITPPIHFPTEFQGSPPPINILYERASVIIAGRGNTLQVYTIITYGIDFRTTETQTILLPTQAPTASMITVNLNNRTIEPILTGQLCIVGQITVPVYKIVLTGPSKGENILQITYHYTVNYTFNKAIIILPVSIHRINGQSFLANYSATITITFINLTNHQVSISLNTPQGQQLGYMITDTISAPEKKFTLLIPVEPYLTGDLVISVTKSTSAEKFYEIYPSSLVPNINYYCLDKKLGITLKLTTNYGRYDIVDLKHWRVGKDLYISFYFYGYGIPSANQTKKIYLHVVFNNILSGEYNIHIIINDNENLTLKYSALCPTTGKTPFTEEEVVGGIIAIIVALTIIMAITTHVHRRKTQQYSP